MKRRARLVALLATLSVSSVFAADWPGYQGPRRDGTSTEKGILRAWPKEGPQVLWTVPLGIGFGGPAVSRGKIYLLDRDDKVGDTLRVHDLTTGKELSTFAYDAPGKFEFPGSRTTPTVDGNIVYVVRPLGDLHAIDINTHKPVWRKNIWKDFGGGAEFISLPQRPGGMQGPPPGAPRSAPPAPPAGQAGPPAGQADPPAAPPGAPGAMPPAPPGGPRGGSPSWSGWLRRRRHDVSLVGRHPEPPGLPQSGDRGPAGSRGGRGRLRQAHG